MMSKDLQNCKKSVEKSRIICGFAGKSVSLHTSNQQKPEKTMEERRFKTRGEQSDYYASLRGWGPLTEEEEAILDDAVRLVTNLD